METPASITKDESNYRPAAWQDYTISELGNFVHLLTKRAGMRTPSDKDKIRKDLTDAQNYLDMAQAMLDDAKTRLL